MKIIALSSNFTRRFAARFAALPRDERGTISIMSVITIFVLAVVLGMVVNAGRQVDEKIRMQNAADAATYSGAVVVARGYNALAFANHVEAEVFALTAYHRTGANMSGIPRDPQATQNLTLFIQMESQILAAWNQVGTIFATSKFPKFSALGQAIKDKVPLEQKLVNDFLPMTNLQANLVLPVFESILGSPGDPLGGAISRFKRSVVLTTPQAAQSVAAEIARMHGNMTTQGKSSGLEKLHGGQPLTAVLWRTNGTPISLGNEQDPLQRTLPVFDPSPTGPDAAAYSQDYYELAKCQRQRWASDLLSLWNTYLLDPFYRGYPLYNRFPPYNVLPGGASAAKASSLFQIWGNYSCAQLTTLLGQYPATNLPYVYRMAGPMFNSGLQCQACPKPLHPDEFDCRCMEGFRNLQSQAPPVPGYMQYVFQNMDPLQNPQQPSYLEQYHLFVGVAYWPRMQQTSPVFYRYPMSIDSMAYAQASVFIPKRRYLLYDQYSRGPWLHPSSLDQFGNQLYANNYDNWPQYWDPWTATHPINLQWIPIWSIENQNWMAKLVPATSDSIPIVLQSSQSQQFAPNVRVPNLGGVSASDLRKINTH